MPESAEQALVRLSARLGAGSREDWSETLREARKSASPAAIEEVILQSYLFVGFPTVLNVLGDWRALASTPAPREDRDLDGRRADGEALCRQVYGPAYEKLRVHVTRLHPDLDRWMIEEGYGKTLSRPGVDVVTRELCVVALLAAGGHIPQLRSHLRGSLNVGASAAQVSEALETGIEEMAAYSSAGVDETVLRETWDQVLSRVRAG